MATGIGMRLVNAVHSPFIMLWSKEDTLPWKTQSNDSTPFTSAQRRAIKNAPKLNAQRSWASALRCQLERGGGLSWKQQSSARNGSFIPRVTSYFPCGAIFNGRYIMRSSSAQYNVPPPPPPPSPSNPSFHFLSSS